MSRNTKQASNSTGFALARETSPGVVDNSAVWMAQEPNSYKDFGGEFKTLARSPINASRQRKKGVIVDLDAAGGWQEDLTFEALAEKIEGLMYADFRVKTSAVATAAAGSDYTVTTTAGIVPGDTIVVVGAVHPANNGKKTVTGVAGGNTVTVAEALTAESGMSARVARVARTFTASAVAYTAATKTLSSAADDFTLLGLIPGEYVYLSADVSANNLGANVGMARVKSVTAGDIVFDKVQAVDPNAPIVDASGMGKSVTLYCASRIIKNETGGLIKRRTYQAERTLGRADTTSLYDQAEYITGALINEGHFVLNTADKATVDWSLVASQYETRASDVGPKPGSRPTSTEGSAFNTATDVKRMNISLVGSDDPQFAFVMDMSLTVKNNNKANKAVGVLGSIDHTEGLFAVSAAVTAYFATVEAASAVANNSDLTLDFYLARDNRGIVFDVPLISLGDGRAKITANEPIQLPLDIEAATASKLSPETDYTLMVGMFDYLPNIAA